MSFMLQTTSWRHSSFREMAYFLQGFLLGGKYFQFVLAEYWPGYIVFPSTVPLPEVVTDQNQTN